MHDKISFFVLVPANLRTEVVLQGRDFVRDNHNNDTEFTKRVGPSLPVNKGCFER